MKTRLDQLTTAEFINLVCGDTDVLLGKHEFVSPTKLTLAMRNIVMEYRSIADPGGNASYLRRINALIKARLSVTIYSMCGNLVELGRYGNAREILKAAGHPAGKWPDRRIETEVHIRLQKARRAAEEAKEDGDGGEDREGIRNAFNAMIATMMAHFKFQIDVATMMAPVFAHLAARYHAEVKEMAKILKSR